MATPEIPNFGRVLAPLLGRVDDADRPRFLARLERGAADRYREWAKAWPEQAGLLDACARREDEIADRVEALYAASADAEALMDALLPEARELYYAAFDGYTIQQQLRIQANAERQGAAAWRAIAAASADATLKDGLETCAALEETSADALDALLGG